ncbi:alr2496 [Nostoc sp. PCC 7120 = FACHB-418]|nr:alr2496 [Nostoc sp. PCC 7120 = FACHB-418]
MGNAHLLIFMKKSTLTLLCLLWVLIPHVAIAGGSSWEYQVVKFKKTSPTSAEFSLRPTRREQNHPRKECKEIVVRARYRPEAFWRRTWSRFVSRRTQNQALRLLAESFQKKKPTRFGEIGTGLKKVNGKACVFESRGLDVRQEHPSKQNAVYSYHESI